MTVSHQLCHSCRPGATALSCVRNTARWARPRTLSSSLFVGASTANQHLRTAATEAVLVFWCLHLTCSSHCYIPHSLLFSLSLSLYLSLSLSLSPSGILVPTPLRPWPCCLCVLEQEEALVIAAPLAGNVTLVDARMRPPQAVHIVVLRRPDADRLGMYSDNCSMDWWRHYSQCHCTGPTQA